MKLTIRLISALCTLGLVLPMVGSAQTPASIVLTDIERITDTGVDGLGLAFGIPSGSVFRRYRREINLVGTINGAASIPAKVNTNKDYNTGIVDKSNAATSSRSYDTIAGDQYNFYGNYLPMVGFTADVTLRDVSGKLIIKEASYEAQRLSSSAVILVFPRSVQTYPINGEPYVILTPTPNPPGSAKWSNLSTRVFAGTGDNSLIVGFVVAGNIPKNFLVRVVGPSLGQFGLAGFMPDPRFQILAQGSTAPVAQNDDWAGTQVLSAAFTSVGAFGFTGPASKDAAAIVTLAPGAYTVIVNAATNNTGVALVEVYEL